MQGGSELTLCPPETLAQVPPLLWTRLFPPTPHRVEQDGAGWWWGALSRPFPRQDLVFDLGDPVRWEYLLLGAEKSHLSLTEEEEDVLNDDDDVENLVSLWRGASMGPGLRAPSCFGPT